MLSIPLQAPEFVCDADIFRTQPFVFVAVAPKIIYFQFEKLLSI